MIPRSRLLVACALMLGLPAALSGQLNLSASAGAGLGSVAFDCEACDGERDTGIALLGRLGVGLFSGVQLSGELTHWRGDYEDTRGTGDARITIAAATLQWHPTARGFFVKGGGGMSFVDYEASFGTLGDVTVETSGPSLLAGIGWDMPMGSSWAITPFATLHLSSKRDVTVNGLENGEQLGGDMLHAGVAITLR